MDSYKMSVEELKNLKLYTDELEKENEELREKLYGRELVEKTIKESIHFEVPGRTIKNMCPEVNDNIVMKPLPYIVKEADINDNIISEFNKSNQLYFDFEYKEDFTNEELSDAYERGEK